MIKVEDAKNLIYVGTGELNVVLRDMKNCIGYALAEDVFSPADFPDFAQSAMDGYGVWLNEQPQSVFTLTGEEQAGNVLKKNVIGNGEALRIFTGAKIPEGVNTVIQQEWVHRSGDEITVQDFLPVIGMNIRPQGSQTKKGELVLKKGSTLTPAGAALLAGLGLDKISVVRKPEIIILNTGKELVAPGNPIQSGQVYESNSFALSHALRNMHIVPKEIIWADDDKVALSRAIGQALEACDLLLITGGVSVGDYDYVVPSLQENEVTQVFHKVKQKPGKPLYYGKKGQRAVFGLPGNPASVMTCFYQYVVPCIKKMMGFEQTSLLTLFLPCLQPYIKKTGLTHYLKGRLTGEGVEILPHQESYKMNTFAIADVLIEIGEDKTGVETNELVKVYLLPV